MQICITWIFHDLFAIQSKVPYLLNTFALNATFLIPKSKSSTTTTNLLSFIGITTIVKKKKKKKTYQNEFDNKQMK